MTDEPVTGPDSSAGCLLFGYRRNVALNRRAVPVLAVLLDVIEDELRESETMLSLMREIGVSDLALVGERAQLDQWSAALAELRQAIMPVGGPAPAQRS